MSAPLSSPRKQGDTRVPPRLRGGQEGLNHVIGQPQEVAPTTFFLEGEAPAEPLCALSLWDRVRVRAYVTPFPTSIITAISWQS